MKNYDHHRKSTNSQGQSVDIVAVYDKQEE